MAETQDINQVHIADSGFFVLRTPLLPINELLAWGDELGARKAWESGADSSVMEKAWATDVQLLRTRLKEIISRAEVAHAIFVASPSLHGALDHWKNTPQDKKGLQAERALVRYFTRMSARATPFGLFSGCSLGSIDPCNDGTSLVLQPRKNYRSHSRLDFDYFLALTAGLQEDPSLRMALRYHPNSSLHKVGDAWHYIESKVTASRCAQHLIKIESDEYLEAVLRRAEHGSSIGDLKEVLLKLSDDTEITSEEAKAYIEDLIENQVLVSNLSPLVTGCSPLDDIIDQLKCSNYGAPFAEILVRVRDEMIALDRKGVGCAPGDYGGLKSELAKFPAKVAHEQVYQVDLIKPVESAFLGKPVIQEILSGVEILRRLDQPREPEDLRIFREAFSARYQRAFVPILEAIDQESGVGFGPRIQGASATPLLRDLGLAKDDSRDAEELLGTHKFLLQKLLDCAREGSDELKLELADFPSNMRGHSSLPDSFAITVALGATSNTAIEKGDFELYFLNALGPCGARYLGRFCHADPELEASVRCYLCEEELHAPKAIFAEVVYLPEGRDGNVLCRPVLRNYEIPYLGRSGAPPDRQIPITDLLVGIEGGSVVLYSKRLGKQIIPRLTAAHNFDKPQFAAAYRFLCHLQYQHGVEAPWFTWGPLQTLDYLPRLKVGRFVLSPTRWMLNQQEISDLTQQERSQQFIAVQKMRERKTLPRWVRLSEFDNALTVDLDNPLSVDAFVHVLKRTSQAILTELCPSPERLCVTSSEGRFYHELNIPLVRRRPTAGLERGNGAARLEKLTCPGVSLAANHSARTLPTGSEWLYVKLYGSPTALDDTLIEEVATLATTAYRSGAASHWFFIRYGDPHEHLRIRFQGLPNRVIKELLPLVCHTFNPLLARGKLWKIQFDTYDREIERYGGIEGVQAAEEIFFADSECAIEILRKVGGGQDLDARWRIALLGTDRLLSDCGLDLEAKRNIARTLRDSHQREFGINAKTRMQMGKKFRAERQKLETLLGYSLGHSAELELAGPAFESRTTRAVPSITKLRSLEKMGRLYASISDLACSYVHMHINRLTCSSARAQELVLYDFLFSLYDGRLARAKYSRDPMAGTVKPEVETCLADCSDDLRPNYEKKSPEGF